MKKLAFADAVLSRVMFLCGGDDRYGRVCEELFNHQARKRRLSWQAMSRVLPGAAGPLDGSSISQAAIAFLERRGISPVDTLRMPLQANEFDFQTVDLVISPIEAEHRRHMEERWSRYSRDVQYWSIGHAGSGATGGVFSALAEQVDDLMAQLLNARASFDAA
jgi:protein-tyrosine phosphatase